MVLRFLKPQDHFVYKLSPPLVAGKGIEKCEHLKLTDEENGKYWLMMTPEELISLNEYFDFSSQTIDECLSQNQVPRLEVYENFSFGVINIINKKKDFYVASELDFYLTSRYLIFVTKNNDGIIEAMKDEINGNSMDLERILYMFLDRLTASDNQILKDIEDDISHIEELVIKGENRDYTIDIVSL